MMFVTDLMIVVIGQMNLLIAILHVIQRFNGDAAMVNVSLTPACVMAITIVMMRQMRMQPDVNMLDVLTMQYNVQIILVDMVKNVMDGQTVPMEVMRKDVPSMFVKFLQLN